jgi:hypothetical protein
MLNSRLEQIASAAGHLFFFAAIILFILLILAAGGVVTAQEFPFTDALEPDALDPDALDGDALEEDALGLEPALIESLAVLVEPVEDERWVRCPYHEVWYDAWTSHCHICWNIPVAGGPQACPFPVIPPRPGVAIAPPPWFCFPCWEWHIHDCPRGFPGSRWGYGRDPHVHPCPFPAPRPCGEADHDHERPPGTAGDERDTAPPSDAIYTKRAGGGRH